MGPIISAPSPLFPRDLVLDFAAGLPPWIWPLYFGTAPHMRGRLRAQDHPTRRVNVDAYRRAGYIVEATYWEMGDGERHRAEAALIREYRPRFNLRIPKYRGAWTWREPDDRGIDLGSVLAPPWGARDPSCGIPGRPGVYFVYAR